MKVIFTLLCMGGFPVSCRVLAFYDRSTRGPSPHILAFAFALRRTQRTMFAKRPCNFEYRSVSRSLRETEWRAGTGNFERVLGQFNRQLFSKHLCTKVYSVYRSVLFTGFLLAVHRKLNLTLVVFLTKTYKHIDSIGALTRE